MRTLELFYLLMKYLMHNLTEKSKISDVVEYVLKEWHITRVSDSHLVYLVRAELTGKKEFGYKDFTSLPKPETIRRVRQKIQESGRYVVKDVREARKRLANDIRKCIPNFTPQQTANAIQEGLFA